MKILIIESNESDYEHLVTLLKELLPGCEIVGHCTSVKESLKWFRNHEVPHLILSVINLPDGLSFDVFSKLKKHVPVIFTCAYEKYAVEAFNTNGVYYIVKPVKKTELDEALKKYRHTQYKHTHVTPDHFQKRFIVHVGKQMKIIDAEDIAYFFTSNKVVYLVDSNGSKFSTRFKLDSLEKLLDPAKFFRINRQFIISLSSITKMIPATKSRLQIVLQPKTNKETITSFGRMDSFYKWILGDHR